MRLANRLMLLGMGLFYTLVAHAQPTSGGAPAPSLSLLRATDMRVDKLAAAPVVQSLAVGVVVRLLSMEGGWALVQAPDNSGEGRSGWVRASALNLVAESAAVSVLPSGRLGSGNTALTLGVRSLPPRANRHALIIGLSRYADPATPRLPGAKIDKQSATQMAQAMQVPSDNIHYLQDEQATGSNIRQALRDLSEKVQDGDRVFIHFSGHGTRYNDPAVGGCVEALLAYEGGQSGMITNREMARLLQPLTNKTDKLFVMYDACHSGGVVQAATSMRTRGFSNANDDGLLRPKFANVSEECGRPVNVKTRSLLTETSNTGALPQDIIHVSASRDNEISFDDEQKGGLATQYVRDCMLREAQDLDHSGAISMDEIRQCAQSKINQRMAGDPNYKAHHLMLNGNADFVPAWFSQAVAVAVAAIPAAKPPRVSASPPPVNVVAAIPVSTPAPIVSEPPVAPLKDQQALQQLFDQRDAKRRVQVTAGKGQLKIGKDSLDLAVQSERAGYVYVALLGSDNQSLYLLFPNDLDQNNHIEAGQQMLLPRPNWRVKASGPVGSDQVLVLVSDSPRDLQSLSATKTGPFMTSLNDVQGRNRLGTLLTVAGQGGSSDCLKAGTQRLNARCSDAFGAALLTIQEIK